MDNPIMTTGFYDYRNSDGTTVTIDVGSLPVTDQPSNIILPNLWVAGDADAEPTGQFFKLIVPQLWVNEATNEIYRTTTPAP